MRVLSDEEIASIINQGDVVEGNRYLPYAFARAVEAAVLERFEVAGFEPAEPYEIEPALVIELIERLEAAEKQRDELLSAVELYEEALKASWPSDVV